MKPMPMPLFEIQNVTKIYGAGLLGGNVAPALADFSLTFNEGEPEITTIAGESGSGKTTLANLVLGFVHPTAGHIKYKGRDIYQMSSKERFNFRREVQAIFIGSSANLSWRKVRQKGRRLSAKRWKWWACDPTKSWANIRINSAVVSASVSWWPVRSCSSPS
jgi:ABC-type glutathione transport system ATPase component